MSTIKGYDTLKSFAGRIKVIYLMLLMFLFLGKPLALAQESAKEGADSKETQSQAQVITKEDDELASLPVNETTNELPFAKDYSNFASSSASSNYAGELSSHIGKGNYNIVLNGDSTWDSPITVKGDNLANLYIDGQGKTVHVISNNTRMLYDFQTASNITLKNINFVPSASYPSENDYLIGIETAGVDTTINLEGSSFTGFNRNDTGKGGIIYAWREDSSLTIDAGEAGLTFKGNRGSWDSAGAVAVFRSDLTFNGKVTFDSNWSGNYGGAINVYDTDRTNKLLFNGETLFKNNHAVVFGGAIDVWGGAATVEFKGKTEFDGNYINYTQDVTNENSPSHINDQHARGGAINIGYINSSGNGASVTFDNDVTFSNNYVQSNGSRSNNNNAYGGAISVYGNGAYHNYNLKFKAGAIFDGNYVNSLYGLGRGGAIYYDSIAENLSFSSNTKFTNNYAKSQGGAIYIIGGAINLSASDGDILFQGNRQGASFDPVTGKPIIGSGTPNAIMFASDRSTNFLNLNASDGYKIEFYDPVAVNSIGKADVVKAGDGDVIFYGDKGKSSDFDTNLKGNTTVKGGNFLLKDGVKYGNTSIGTFTVESGGAVGGGGDSTLRTTVLNVQNGGAITGTGGTFNIESSNINMADGSKLTGYGTIDATSDLKISGTINADIADGMSLEMARSMAGSNASLVKTGEGTLEFSKKNAYTGVTNINEGTLKTNIANAFAQSSQVTVNNNAVLDLNNYSQIANEFSGTGDVELGSATLTVNNTTGKSFSGSIGGTGVLTKTGTGNLILSGASDYSGGTNINAGSITSTNGSALGTGRINVTNSGILNLDFADKQTVNNQILASGVMNKTGDGTAILTNSNSSVSSVNVNKGKLSLQQNGTFAADNFTTASNAVTEIGGSSDLKVNGTFKQNDDSVLEVAVGEGSEAKIVADKAQISGTLNVTGYQPDAPAKASELTKEDFVVISSTDKIVGDFTSVNTGTSENSVDYLVVNGGKSEDERTYSVGLGLTWEAGKEKGHGNFTLNNAKDSFELDVVLQDKSANFDSGWDGKSLTKEGEGTLILSKQNQYTGKTDILQGTLSTKAENAFASSSQVTLGKDATLLLNDTKQIAKEFSGQGDVKLGSGTLTINNNTNDKVFSGTISGTGGINKTGTGNFTMSGENGYKGNTNINAGSLTITNGKAVGQGTVNISKDTSLNLDFSDKQTVGNQLIGSGELNKTGMGTAVIENSDSAVATVNVDSGELSLQQDGTFIANDFTTAANATTSIGASSQLETNNFTQDADSTLNVAIGADNAPTIKADAADIEGSHLNITGFGGKDAPGKASMLDKTDFVVISTTDGINGDFASVNTGGASTAVDYLVVSGKKSEDNLTYSVGMDLAWTAGKQNGTGSFTLNNANDAFEVDVVLKDQVGTFDKEWDGSSLTKKGDGTLILSKQNEYTGKTDIQEGTLSTKTDNAFASSSQVTLGSGANLVLNGNSQKANEFSGAGNVTLGGATLNINNNSNDKIFSGSINGAGSITKTGTGNIILSGKNTYTKDTNINEGSITATNGDAFGSSKVNIDTDGSLILDFADGQKLSNKLAGDGDLVKQGTGTAILDAEGSSVGNVKVTEGTLSLEQNGIFNAVDFTTDNGTTSLGENASLNLSGGYKQGSGGSLYLALAKDESESNTKALLPENSNPKIDALDATIEGKLYITNFDRTLPASALLARRDTVMTTQNGITGNFSKVEFGGPLLELDYLVLDGKLVNGDKDYSVGYNLTWNTDENKANGDFTLAGKKDVFEVDIALTDKTGNFASGWDGSSLTKKGDGSLLLTEKNTYTGKTDVQEGILIVGDEAASTAQITGSGVTVAKDAVLSGGGTIATNVKNSGTIASLNVLGGYSEAGISNMTTGKLENSGTILLAGREVGNTLTIQGGLTGDDGKLVINTVLGDDSSLTDKLILDDGATTGMTNVVVNNVGGMGGETQKGILVVDAVNNATTSTDAFKLSSISSGYRNRADSLALGAFDYKLIRGGNGGSEQSWYLVSNERVRPEGGSYLVNSETSQSMFYHSMRDRLENYEIAIDPQTGEAKKGNAWGRVMADRSRSYAGGEHLRTNTNRTVMQVGWDLVNKKSEKGGSFRAGIMAGYGSADSRTKGADGFNADGDVSAYSVGAYATWFKDPQQKKGLYVDAWAQNAWFKNSVRGEGLSGESYDANMLSASIEAGYAFDLKRSESYAWQLVPVAQITYNNYSADSFRETSGTMIKSGGGDFFQTRLGLRLQGNSLKNENSAHPYVELNWLHRNKTSTLRMDDHTLEANGPKSIMELKTGFDFKLSKKFSLGLNVSYQMGEKNYRNLGGQIGLSYSW